MAFELEALVGHLYIAGGRSISTNPPGALAETAPRSAARGRAGDTFFTLIVPAGSIAPMSFYEQMAKLAAERYFSVAGSVPNALRTVFQMMNRNLYEHNQEQGAGGQQFEAGMIAAVLRDEDLYVGRAGAVLSVLQTTGLTLTLPEDPADDAALFSTPLGALPEPEIKMMRYGVNLGSRVVLSDASVADISRSDLSSILLQNDLEAVLDGLRDGIATQGQLMLMELVPFERQVPLAAPGESSSEVRAKLNAARAEVDADERAVRRREASLGKLFGKISARLAAQGAAGLERLDRLLERLMPLPNPDSNRGVASGTVTLAVVLIPIVMVIIVIGFWVSNLGETDFEQCLGELQDASSLARSIDSSNRSSLLSSWNAALRVVDICESLRPGDATVAAMRDEAQDLIDLLNNVQRRVASPLTALENATITRLRLQGLDMYALDAESDLVYRIKLNDDGRSIARQEPVPSMRRGATVDGLSIGQIVDIAFDDKSGDLALIDENGTLVRCSPQFIMDCNAQRVLAVDRWEQPTALTVWERRLYILDSEVGQIWRYDASGSSYASPPREYFAGEARPNLRNVVDFTISADGAIFILYSDGVMKKYVGGIDNPFTFSGFNEGSELAGNRTEGFAMNDSQFAPAFYIISRRARTVFETTLAGTFIDSYQAFEQDKLELLSSVAVYPAQNILYLASGNAIFTIQK